MMKLKQEQENQIRREQEENARQEKEEPIKVENEKSTQGKKLGITDVKTAVKQGKVTISETQKATNEMGDIYAIKRLQLRRQMGEQLTVEQLRQVEEYENQKELRKQQHKTQRHTKGMSMGL